MSLLSAAASYPSQCYIQAVAANPEGSWPQVWDTALNTGAFGTTCALAMLRFLSLHTFSNNLCPIPGCSNSVESEPLCAHFLADQYKHPDHSRALCELM